MKLAQISNTMLMRLQYVAADCGRRLDEPR